MSKAQQEAVYEAQSALYGHGRRFDTVEEVRAYLDGILDSEWFQKEYGYWGPIQVYRSDSKKWAGTACPKTQTITLSVLKESVVLHELAHLICGSEGHDHCFVNSMLRLVHNAMGFYAWVDFRTALKKTEEFKNV